MKCSLGKMDRDFTVIEKIQFNTYYSGIKMYSMKTKQMKKILNSFSSLEMFSKYVSLIKISFTF